MIELAQGDLLKSNAEALVNTVNCVGSMGKGLALQFREAFPGNNLVYRTACAKNELAPGELLIFSTGFDKPKYIINFPTKVHWRNPSKLEYIDLGLATLAEQIRALDIKSIAIPPLGCGLGGLDWNDVKPQILKTFDSMPDVTVLLFEPQK